MERFEIKNVPLSQSDPISSFKRAQAIEFAAFENYRDAVAKAQDSATQQVLMKIHADACKNAQMAKASVEEFEEWTDGLLEEIGMKFSAWAEAVRMALDSMAAGLASKVNPSDPQVAEKIIRDWLNGTLLPLMKDPDFNSRRRESA
jgi:hypothetical protein